MQRKPGTKSLANKSQQSINFDRVVESIDRKILQRIVEGLVRVEDIVENKPVYGGISKDQRLVIANLLETSGQNIKQKDIIEEFTAYLETCVFEAIPPTPLTPTPGYQPPKPAPGAQTRQAVPPVQPVQPAANLAIASQTMDPEKFKRDIANKLKTDPKAGEEFATLLSRLLQKK